MSYSWKLCYNVNGHTFVDFAPFIAVVTVPWNRDSEFLEEEYGYSRTIEHDMSNLKLVENERERDPGAYPNGTTELHALGTSSVFPNHKINANTSDPVSAEVASIILHGYRKAKKQFPISEGYRFSGLKAYPSLQVLLCDLFKGLGFTPEVSFRATTDGRLFVWFNVRVKIPEFCDDFVDGFMRKRALDFDDLRLFGSRIDVEARVLVFEWKRDQTRPGGPS
ncbi:hypothetical protein L218DRAFT_1007771 [Marasmius fiardii PR-910]|nr:hypothetical protein L218DRAFT_1007771 [Marasmius fiardii PR-910]